MARKHEVLALHAKGMSSPEIAGHLGCMAEYVRATLQRAGLRSHSKRGRALPRCQTKGLVVEIQRHTPLAEDVMAEIGERASVALCAKLGVAPSADWHVLRAVMVGRVIRVAMVRPEVGHG